MNRCRKDKEISPCVVQSCVRCRSSPLVALQLSSTLRWMLVLFFTAGGSCSITAFSSRAQATLAQVTKKTQKVLYTNNRFQQRFPKSTGLLSTSDDDDEFDAPAVNGQGKQPSRTPRTGWNHNQPDLSSNFWGSTSDQAERETSRNDSPPKNKPRTGWLHNQQPRSAADKAASKDKTVTSANSDSSATTSVARWRLNLAKMQQERNHRILSSPAFHSCGENGQMVVTEHLISLPLYRNKDVAAKQTTNVFFTIVERVADDDESRTWWRSLSAMSPTQRAQQYVQKAQMKDASSMILYLQGGPGFGAPAPVVGLGLAKESSWAAQALAMPQFSRVVLMDQRGTGRSNPITKQSLERRFPDLFRLDRVSSGNPTLEELEESYPDDVKLVKQSLEAAVRYLAQFRADNIVRDAEEIRDALLLPLTPDEKEILPRPWGAALGQSFGGFCLMTYLSQEASPPKVCLFTGGIAPMLTPAYDLYRTLWGRVKERNLRYYDMYPDDISLVKRIVQRLLDKPAMLPSRGMLTARRFLQLGLGLGGSPSSFASLHDLLTSAFLKVEEGDHDELEFTRAFLKQVDIQQSFDNHPIYFWLHESIYADGPSNSPTNWAAHRAYEDLIQTSSDFDYAVTSRNMQSADAPTLFFGEMVFPWMADGDYAELSGLGLGLLANALATKTDWPPLFDGDHMHKVLQDGSVNRAAAAVYYDDLYVDFDASVKVTSRGRPLEKVKVWISNEYQHSGLRDNGASMFAKLWGMATGSNRIPS